MGVSICLKVVLALVKKKGNNLFSINYG